MSLKFSFSPCENDAVNKELKKVTLGLIHSLKQITVFLYKVQCFDLFLCVLLILQTSGVTQPCTDLAFSTRLGLDTTFRDDVTAPV